MSSSQNPAEGESLDSVPHASPTKPKSYRLRRWNGRTPLEQAPPEGPGKEELAAELARLREELQAANARALIAEQQCRQFDKRLIDSRESISQRDKTIDEARRALADARTKLLRSRSDIDAQRTRHLREKEEMQKLAAEELLRQLFPILDNFGFAMETMKNAQSVETAREGVTMIFREFEKVMVDNGLEQIGIPGEEFDPQTHDAVSAQENSAEKNNIVLQVMRAGYMLRGTVLRPAMVVVNRLPEAELPPEAPPPHIKEVEASELPEAPPEGEIADEKMKHIPPHQAPSEASEENESPLERARRMFDSRF